MDKNREKIEEYVEEYIHEIFHRLDEPYNMKNLYYALRIIDKIDHREAMNKLEAEE